MSSYCGVVHRRGAPIEDDELAAMCAGGGAKREPDASGRWLEGSAGFFHAMRYTTPESLGERLPWQHPASGLVITADARVDNRTEIGAALGLSAVELRSISDSEILLKGYLRWKEELLQHVLGDFSFAIWDPRRRTLFCARDHFGVRPFYHSCVGDEFLFATNLKSIFAHPKVSKRLNADRWVRATATIPPVQSATFYEDIHRLAPGSWLRFDEDGLFEQRYWSLNPDAQLPPRENHDYAKEFESLFAEAVRCRLRSAYPVGTHLSGGLDSSAVTCVARKLLREEGDGRHLPLRTISNLLPTIKSCDETEYIKSVEAGGDVQTIYAYPDQNGTLFAMDEFLAAEDDFIFFPNLYLLEHLGAAAEKGGVRVCLDGFDGDTTVGHGYERLTDLARAGNWSAFCREAKLVLASVPAARADQTFYSYGLPVLDHLAKARRWRKYALGWLTVFTRYDRCVRRPLVRHLLKSLTPAPLLSLWWRIRRREPQPGRLPLFFRAPFAVKLQVFAEIHRPEPDDRPCTVRRSQCEKFSSGLFSHVLEVVSRLSERYGLDMRHPFLDKRLVEFCVALPSEQKLHRGRARHIMREGLRNVLPEVVRSRMDKPDYTWAHVRGFIRHDRQRLTALIDGLRGRFESVIDLEALTAYYENLTRTQRTSEHMFLAFWRALMGVCWLQNTRFAADDSDPVSKVAALLERLQK